MPPGMLMPRGILGMAGIPLALPPIIPFIIWRICSNWRTSWLTCCTVTPAPLAIRARRLPLRISGLRRSAMVMELMMASVRAISFSGMAPLASASFSRRPPMPGIIFKILSREPSFLIRRIWVRKSSRSKLALRIFLARASASSASMVAWAFSTRVSTSPMPRMRPAMRSGWKTSISDSFSPIPTNFTGAPVTARMDRAAPPRASPSILVSTTPVRPRRSLKDSATVTAS